MKIKVIELGNSKEKRDSAFAKDSKGFIKFIFKFNLEELLMLLNKES